MGILSFLGLKRNDKLLQEITELKRELREQKERDVEIGKVLEELEYLYSEINDIKISISKIEREENDREIGFETIAQKILNVENQMLKFVDSGRVDVLEEKLKHFEKDLEEIKEEQRNLIERFISYILEDREKPKEKPKEKIELTEFQGFLTELIGEESVRVYDLWKKVLKSRKVTKEHVSRELKNLYEMGVLGRKKKGKEFIYYSKL